MNINSLTAHSTQNKKHQPSFSGTRTIFKFYESSGRPKPNNTTDLKKEISGKTALNFAKRVLQQIAKSGKKPQKYEGNTTGIGVWHQGKRFENPVQVTVGPNTMEVQRSLNNQKTGFRKTDTAIFPLNAEGEAKNPEDASVVNYVLRKMAELSGK